MRYSRCNKKRTIKLCRDCFSAYEYHNGKQNAVMLWVNPKDPEESFCAFCKNSGFDTLYKI